MRARTYNADPLVIDQATTKQLDGYSTQVGSYVSEGLLIKTLVATPTSAKPARGYPTVIVSHGYMPGNDYATEGQQYRAVVAGLAKAGFRVLLPDYRGHGESWGAEVSAYYNTGYVYDTINLVRALQQDRLTDRNNLGIWGHSLGAHLAVKTLQADPGSVKAAALMAGANTDPVTLYNLPLASEGNLNNQIARTDRQALVRVHGEPSSDSAFWKQASVVNFVRDIQADIMIMHCSDDDRVPFELSTSFADRLRAADKAVTFHSCVGGGHGFIGATEPVMVDNTVRFFSSKLK